jgi:hypothetical protein
MAAMADAENKTRSYIWQYFDRKVEQKEITGVCKVEKCKKPIKCVSGSTSSLIAHLKSTHSGEYKKYELAVSKKRALEEESNKVCYLITY